MKHIFITVISLFLYSSFCFAQQVFISGAEGNRDLIWSDFKGKPDAGSPYFAYTIWNINYKYSDVNFKEDSATLVDFTVILELDADSWVKHGDESDDLLKHEQGHFDIAHLAMLEIIQSFKNVRFSPVNTKTEINNSFTAIIDEYKAIEIKYDDETQHGTNLPVQNKWSEFIKEQFTH